MRDRALLLTAALALACGGQTGTENSGTGSTGGTGGSSVGGSGNLGGTGGSGNGAGTGGSGNSAGTGGIDCSNVGCSPPPMCDPGCTATCGCCSCADGEKIPVTGGFNLCQGGCYVFVPTKTCGGLAGLACAPDEWCDLPDGCGFPDATGNCEKRPQACYADCPGVCGCDGKQYCNVCEANSQGIDTSDDKSCMAGNPCATDQECAPGLKCCYPCGIPGCTNQCTVPTASGECPMYP